MKKSELLEHLNEYEIDLELNEMAKNTIESYIRYSKLFINYIDHDNEITKSDVIAFKKYIMETIGFSSSTTNHVIVCINKYFNYLKLDDLKVKRTRVQNQSTVDEIMTAADVKRLLRIAKRDKQYQMYMIMKVLANTGIRNEELKFITYENIKSKDMFIVVRNKGKTRKVPIKQELRRDLLKYCKERNITSGLIFYSKTDKKKMPHRSTIFRNLKKIAGAARVKKSVVYAHAFRHFFAVEYLLNGGDALTLANILGHNSLATTQKYTILTLTQMRREIENKTHYY